MLPSVDYWKLKKKTIHNLWITVFYDNPLLMNKYKILIKMSGGNIKCQPSLYSLGFKKTDSEQS